MCSRYEGNNKIIYPGDTVNIYIEYNKNIVGIHSLWGFKNRGNVVFNARCENMNQYSLFKDLKHCIIKTDNYFEWDQAKHKIIFRSIDGQSLLMAGLVRKNNGKNEHTIITTFPNQSVQGIHHRMPLILNREQAIQWLFNNNSEEILNSIPEELEVSRNIEQMELKL